jgi:hypothetical protein
VKERTDKHFITLHPRLIRGSPKRKTSGVWGLAPIIIGKKSFFLFTLFGFMVLKTRFNQYVF